MDERKELLVTDLKNAFTPKENLTFTGEKDKWRVAEYITPEFSGSLLASLSNSHPGDITFSPGLTGWYKIYLQLVTLEECSLFIKLSSSRCFDYVSPSEWDGSGRTIQEFMWCMADMTGESVVVTMRKAAVNQMTFFSGLRFVPMTDEEVRALQADDARTDTKNLYCTNDMHNVLYCTNVEEPNDWLSTVLPLRHSDTEWIGFEELRGFMSGRCPVDPEKFAFIRDGDYMVEKQLRTEDYDRVLKTVTDACHENGIKASVSIRMGAWGLEFPYNKCYFDCIFNEEHPELRCVARDGTRISRLSYAFRETRDYIISTLVRAARCGCDAVMLIAHRGPVFLLYEKPVAELFFERYGEWPYAYPLDDPRLNSVHCEFMTRFFRELRQALDLAYGKDKIEIHLRGLFSLADNKSVGLDCEALAKEGLINRLIAYPQRQAEMLSPEVWADEARTRIDPDKYRESMQHRRSYIAHYNDFDFKEPFVGSGGRTLGPKTQKERCQEFVDFERRTGVAFYMDILPRIMPTDTLRKRVQELYDMGITRLSPWDTYQRVWNTPMWNALRRFGRRDKIGQPTEFEQGGWLYRILEIDGMEVGYYDPMIGG